MVYNMKFCLQVFVLSERKFTLDSYSQSKGLFNIE